VHFADTGCIDERAHVLAADPRPREQHEAPGGAPVGGGDRAGAVDRAAGLARGQDARAAQAGERVDSGERIGEQVEGAVERHRQATRVLEHVGEAPFVDLAVGGQEARDDAVDADRAQHQEVVPQHHEVVLVVEEVAAARPQHHEHRQRHRRAHGREQARRRRQATFVEAAAEFDAVCAAAFRRECTGDRIDGDFDEHGRTGGRWLGGGSHRQYGPGMRAQLLHLSGPLRGHTITYPGRTVRIGALAGSDAVLADPKVKEKHALIEWVEAECQFYLRRREGQVFVNGHEVVEVILQDGDQIEFGAGGPKARFRIYVPTGAVCKPVRRMLADARDVARASGGAAATQTLTRDLLMRATPTLKVGFPLAVVTAAFLTGWLGGWLGSRPNEEELRRTVDSVTKAELEELRRLQTEQRQVLARLAEANAVIGRIQREWSQGVCLIHGVYRVRMADGTWLMPRGSDPFEVEYTGSGFLVTERGHVVTNRHVVAPWLEEQRLAPLLAAGAVGEFVHLTATFPGHKPVDVVPASILRRTDDLDVAVFVVDPQHLAGVPVLPMHDAADGGAVGGDDQRAIVVGYPTGLAALLARASSQAIEVLRQKAATMTEAIAQLAEADQIAPVITSGVVSNVEEHVIAYDASTTHGGSGGPVFGGHGKVIAVNFAIQRNFGGNNLGVPIRFARELLPE
jgi:serine protease Do